MLQRVIKKFTTRLINECDFMTNKKRNHADKKEKK